MTAGDAHALGAILRHPDVRAAWSDPLTRSPQAIDDMIAESIGPASSTSLWRIASADTACIGLVGLRPPSTTSLALRAIGWRSRELVLALDPDFQGHGLAREAIEAIAAVAGADGVTFALVACVDEANQRALRLLVRCGFEELGRGSGAARAIVVYERAV